jgi:hypothetical protein
MTATMPMTIKCYPHEFNAMQRALNEAYSKAQSVIQDYVNKREQAHSEKDKAFYSLMIDQYSTFLMEIRHANSALYHARPQEVTTCSAL